MLNFEISFSQPLGVLPVGDFPDAGTPPVANSAYENPIDSAGEAVSSWGENIPDYGLVAVVTIPGTRILDGWSSYGPIEVEMYSPGWDGLSPSAGGEAHEDTPMSPCHTPGNKIDWQIVTNLEGGNQLKGYIPNNGGIVIGRSGVTIAAGFDIGQHSIQEIKNMNLPSALEAKLLPYAYPLIKQNALDYLKSHPLSITYEESVAINAASHAVALAHLQVAYDDATGIKGAFYDLPANTQTALASFAFQVGSIAKYNAAVWSDLTHFHWNDAVNKLQSMTQYQDRRQTEANLIQGDQSNGCLVDGKLN